MEAPDYEEEMSVSTYSYTIGECVNPNLDFYLFNASSSLMDSPSSGAVFASTDVQFKREEEFNLFKNVDSLTVQYRKKLGVGGTEDEPNPPIADFVLEKRKLECDYDPDSDIQPMSSECAQSEADKSKSGFIIGGGCFGKGVKSKMKERRRKQQLILSEYRPKWDDKHFPLSTSQNAELKDTSDSGKRVRFNVSEDDENTL